MIDLALSDEQTRMVEGAARLLAEHCPVARLRPGGAAADPHDVLADWGWFGVGIAEADGGLGLGLAEETLLHFEAGRALLPPSALATTLAAHLAGSSQRPDLVDGTVRAALALADGAEGVYCFDREGAELLVVFGGGKIGLASADAFDGASRHSFDETVGLEAGRLSADRLARQDDRHGALLASAMLAGMARACCTLAVDYAKLREQFGQPIGAFQAIKHICADMALRAYAAEAQVKLAAVTAAAGSGSREFQIRAAAMIAAEAARDNARAAIQVHGGIGFTADCDAHVYLKRAHLLSQLLGGAEAQRDALLACPAPD